MIVVKKSLNTTDGSGEEETGSCAVVEPADQPFCRTGDAEERGGGVGDDADRHREKTKPEEGSGIAF